MRISRLVIFVLLVSLGICVLVGCQDNEPCTDERATLELSASTKALRVGEALTVTVELANEGCVDLGLPQYRLHRIGRGRGASGLPRPRPLGERRLAAAHADGQAVGAGVAGMRPFLSVL